MHNGKWFIGGIFTGMIMGAVIVMAISPLHPERKHEARLTGEREPTVEMVRSAPPDYITLNEPMTCANMSCTVSTDCLIKGIDRAGKPAWLEARCSR